MSLYSRNYQFQKNKEKIKREKYANPKKARCFNVFRGVLFETYNN